MRAVLPALLLGYAITVPTWSMAAVVAITAGLYGEESQDWVSFDILDKFVLAAVRN